MNSNENLQIRRPNELFNHPQKQNLELLLDVLGFNFYVRNPDKTEFEMSWIELREDYGISVTNKPAIKKKLEDLQKKNFISHLKTWNYGFSYRFENTIVDLEGFRKPRSWTFLDYTVMSQLNSITYKVYTLAYKFYDFTRERAGGLGNETKFLEIPDFLKLFSYTLTGKTSHKNLSNKLLAEVRKAVRYLNENHGMKIEVAIKKFGRPIRSIKLRFYKVPKLRKLVRYFKSVAKELKENVEQVVETVTESVEKVKKVVKKSVPNEKRKKSPIPDELSTNFKSKKDAVIKKTKRELAFGFINSVIKGLFEREFNNDKINKLKEWIEARYGRNLNISYDGVMIIFEMMRSGGQFKSLYYMGILKNGYGIEINENSAYIKSSSNLYNIEVPLKVFDNNRNSIIDSVKGAFQRV